MSAAVLHDLAHVEIALRNAYDRVLTTHAPPGAPHWTADPWRYFPAVTRRAANGAPYDANQPREQIARARSGASHTAPPGKVIAALMFGFWRYLSTSAHEVPLWRPYLHHGFLPGTSRRAVDGPIVRLHKLRNRVAHQEPLLAQNLTQATRTAGRSPTSSRQTSRRTRSPSALGPTPNSSVRSWGSGVAGAQDRAQASCAAPGVVVGALPIGASKVLTLERQNVETLER